MAEVLEELRAIVETQLQREATLLPEQRLDADLGLDSLELTVLAVAVENRFRVRLQESDGPPLETVQQLVELVLRRREEAGLAEAALTEAGV